MRFKTGSNFSFKRALSALDELENQFILGLTEDFIDSAKRDLTSGELRPLKKSTERSRKKGKYWGREYGSEYIVHHNTPLEHTGRLINSLKKSEDGTGFEIVEYGLIHNEGWTTNRGVPIKARRFLPIDKNGKWSKEFTQLKKNKQNNFTFILQHTMKR